MMTVLFLSWSLFLFFFVTTINHKPLHLAERTFALTSISTTSSVIFDLHVCLHYITMFVCLAGVKAGHIYLCQVASNTVISYGRWCFVGLWRVFFIKSYTPSLPSLWLPADITYPWTRLVSLVIFDQACRYQLHVVFTLMYFRRCHPATDCPRWWTSAAEFR